MTGVSYAPGPMGRRGPQPQHGAPKAPFSTRLKIDVKEFLASRENQAAWLERAVEAHPEFVEWVEARREAGESGEAAAEHWCDGCREAMAEAERTNSAAPYLKHLAEVAES